MNSAAQQRSVKNGSNPSTPTYTTSFTLKVRFATLPPPHRLLYHISTPSPLLAISTVRILLTISTHRCRSSKPLHPLRRRPKTRRKRRKEKRSKSLRPRSPSRRRTRHLQNNNQASRTQQTQTRHRSFRTGGFWSRHQKSRKRTRQEIRYWKFGD